MKHLAITVTGVGDVHELTCIALVKLDNEHLETLAKLRRTANDINAQVKSLQRSFAYMALWTIDVVWLVVDYADPDEATGKIYEKLCDSDDGYIELPEDVYDGRIRKHMELYKSPEGGGMLRTANDFIRVDERGIYYTCEEKHCYAQHETNLVPWHILFDEPKPEERRPNEEAIVATAGDRLLGRSG